MQKIGCQIVLRSRRSLFSSRRRFQGRGGHEFWSSVALGQDCSFVCWLWLASGVDGGKPSLMPQLPEISSDSVTASMPVLGDDPQMCLECV